MKNDEHFSWDFTGQSAFWPHEFYWQPPGGAIQNERCSSVKKTYSLSADKTINWKTRGATAFPVRKDLCMSKSFLPSANYVHTYHSGKKNRGCLPHMMLWNSAGPTPSKIVCLGVWDKSKSAGFHWNCRQKSNFNWFEGKQCRQSQGCRLRMCWNDWDSDYPKPFAKPRAYRFARC